MEREKKYANEKYETRLWSSRRITVSLPKNSKQKTCTEIFYAVLKPKPSRTTFPYKAPPCSRTTLLHLGWICKFLGYTPIAPRCKLCNTKMNAGCSDHALIPKWWELLWYQNDGRCSDIKMMGDALIPKWWEIGWGNALWDEDMRLYILKEII